jgi:hypothetical protein
MRLSTWASCHGRSEPSRIPSRERGLLPATYGVEQGLGPQAPETFEDVGRPVEDVPAPSAVPSPGRALSPAIGTRPTPLPGAIPPCGEGRSSDETRRQRLIAPIPLLRGPVRGDYRRTVTLELTPIFAAVAWDTNGVIPGVELTLLRPFRCLRRRRVRRRRQPIPEPFSLQLDGVQPVPTDWLRAGVAMQQTRAFRRTRNFQGSLPGGEAFSRVEGQQVRRHRQSARSGR